jgi:hypothetical protein
MPQVGPDGSQLGRGLGVEERQGLSPRLRVPGQSLRGPRRRRPARVAFCWASHVLSSTWAVGAGLAPLGLRRGHLVGGLGAGPRERGVAVGLRDGDVLGGLLAGLSGGGVSVGTLCDQQGLRGTLSMRARWSDA